MLKEYLAHLLISTPLEAPARFVRSLPELRKQQQFPELRELYKESSRIAALLERTIQNPMNCIDIGCHLGSTLSQIRQRSPQGKHLAIEPVPYKAIWLKKKFPEVDVRQVALSDREGEADFFFQPQQSGFSGLRLHQGGNQAVQQFKVSCQRLDDLVPSDRPIGFIKMDVEGAELFVLRGAQALLQRCRPLILFECTQSGLSTFDLPPNAIYDFLTQQGYSVFLIKTWLANGQPLSFDQFAQAMQYPFQAFNFLAVATE